MHDISLNCPGCGQSLEAPEEMAGQEVECPACNAFMLKVPMPDSAATGRQKSATGGRKPARSRSEPRVLSHGKRKRKSSFGPLLCLYGLVVLLCGMFMGAIAYWHLTEDAGKPAPSDEKPRELTKIGMDEDGLPEDASGPVTFADESSLATENDEPAVKDVPETEAESRAGPAPGEDWTSPASGMELVWVESLGLWVGKYEVVNAEYQMKAPDHDSGRERGQSLSEPRQPVVRVNFSEARRFAEWLTEQDRQTNHLPDKYRYRLPTGTEWTAFARCGDHRQYPWGGDWPPPSGRGLNYADEITGYETRHQYTAPVDALWRNEWGLCGVGGNVWEVTANRPQGEFEAWRGGSWNDFEQEMLRCNYQYRPFPFGADTRLGNLGFRLVLSP